MSFSEKAGVVFRKAAGMTAMISLLMVSSPSAAGSVLSGRVVDKDSKPLQGAKVELVVADTSIVTDGNGNFKVDLGKLSMRPGNTAAEMISLRNGVLSISSPAIHQSVQVEAFDTKGQRVGNVMSSLPGVGVFECGILPDALPTAMYIVKIRIGSRMGVFRVLNSRNRTYSLSGRELYPANSRGKKSARILNSVDTLRITKDGYLETRVPVESYIASLPDVILMNDPAKEEGLPPVVNGRNARTTRYWDCCKPHCGWHSDMRMCDISGNDLNDRNAQSGCSGGTSFQCWDYAPIEVNSKVSYGWAAFNNSGTQCGDCFQLDFQIGGGLKQMIVQVINIGDGGTDAFDLLIPGGGVGALNGCSRQWNNAPLGQQYGGFHSTCGDNKDCILNMCKAAFGDKVDLMRGCNWYIDWFRMANNPGCVYMKVPCPQMIKDISHIGN